MVMMVCLLSPVILLSASLCSPALCSAGFLLLLAIALREGEVGWRRLLMVGFCTMGAVSCRADAVLALPFLSCLVCREERVWSLVRDKRIWVMLAVTGGALLVGKLVFPLERHQPDRFFTPLLFVTYFCFGLGGAVILYGAILVRLLGNSVRDKTFFSIMLGLSFCAPMLYYATAFFTPRYLILSVTLLLVSLFFERGRRQWSSIAGGRFGRGAVIALMVMSVLSTVIGVRLQKGMKPVIATESVSLYPTADGFWSMGATGRVLSRLAFANEKPLDHNQRLWDAWKSVPKNQVPQEVEVVSVGFKSMGKLWLTAAEKQYVKGASLMFDGRSVLRSGQPFLDRFRLGAVKGVHCVSHSALAMGADIFLEGGEVFAPQFHEKLALSHFSRGDDFRLSGFPEALFHENELEAHRWLIWAPTDELELLHKWLRDNQLGNVPQMQMNNGALYDLGALKDEQLRQWTSLGGEVLYARSTLPAIMSKNALK